MIQAREVTEALKKTKIIEIDVKKSESGATIHSPKFVIRSWLNNCQITLLFHLSEIPGVWKKKKLAPFTSSRESMTCVPSKMY